jgi:hypothetical protein
MTVRPGARAIIFALPAAGPPSCKNRSLMLPAEASRKPRFTFNLAARVPLRDAREALSSGWLSALDGGLFEDPMLAQTWVFRARPAAGKWRPIGIFDRV